jgi:5'-3' exonuclease
MSLEDLDLIDYVQEDKTLLVDGDLVVFQSCCVFNEDDDQSRRMIQKNINKKIDDLMEAAGCNMYLFLLTTKFNFRNFLIDDYKGNRDDAEKPVNLSWAKSWAAKSLNSHYFKMLEADDLLGILMTEHTVLWSLDKDLRQIPGFHLDDKTRKIVTITEEGTLYEFTVTSEKTGKKKKKVYFDGNAGLYFQMLIGDSTDNILGCAIRERAVRKTGVDKGQEYIRRKGVGSTTAVKLLMTAALYKGDRSIDDALVLTVISEYKKVHKENWQFHLETQANLLFMVRKQYGNVIKRWTFDGRDEYFCLDKGVILDDYNPPNT